MWDNWKYRENHGYGCPMLRVGDQNGLMVTNGCPMGGIIGHGLGIRWAIGGPAGECLLRDGGARQAEEGGWTVREVGVISGRYGVILTGENGGVAEIVKSPPMALIAPW